MNRVPTTIATWTTLGCASLLALLLAVSLGSATEGPFEVWRGLLVEQDPLARVLIMELRLPRALAAYCTGGALALAGLLMQVLLRNPLADPYVLGVSGGAAVAALACLLLGVSGLWLHLAAAGGAMAVTWLVFALAGSRASSERLLLTGVVVASACGAGIGMMLAVADAQPARGMLFWLMGEVGDPALPWLLAGLLLAVTPVLIAAGRGLDVLARGTLQAAALGLSVRAARNSAFLLASLLTAAAVTQSGTIGFIGLVTPHLMRQWVGNAHRRLVPASLLAGGTLLTLADLLARTLFSPRQLPVGAVTALLGVPAFLYLLARRTAR
ncbi:MAG: FecCD family ABC transporter permease [Steroidobacteraceae bacterium]